MRLNTQFELFKSPIYYQWIFPTYDYKSSTFHISVDKILIFVMPDISGVTRHMCSSPHVFGEQCQRRRQARVQPPYHSILGLEETIWHAEEGRTESRKDIFTYIYKKNKFTDFNSM